MPTTTAPQRRSRNQRLGFTIPQQVLYRPLVNAAWSAFCKQSGTPDKDKAAKRAWYETHLETATGKLTTSLCNRTSDFEDAMGYFEALGGDSIKWQMRGHEGALRRARYGLQQFCQEHGVEDDYVAGTARKMYDVADPAKLKPDQLTGVLVALKLNLQRHDAPAQELPFDAMKSKTSQWQDRIRDELCKQLEQRGVKFPDRLIDGSGVDSADPIDVTLVEITQAFGQLDELRGLPWKACADDLPDSDVTVMIFNAKWESEDVWLGFLDGDDWRTADGALFEDYDNSVEPPPTHWAHIPEGPR